MTGPNGGSSTGGAPRPTPHPARGLTVHAAARVEDLLDPLVERLRDPARLPDDPFASITIMVQSNGMQRWLSHQLAEGLDDAGRGIATTVDFPFPGKLLTRIVAACLGEDPDAHDPWARDRLPWPILTSLRAQADDPAFRRLTRYLGGKQVLETGVIDRRAWRFADNVADVFDRYVLHRPEMVSRWAAGEDVGSDGGSLDDHDLWQPRLWRDLVARHDDPTKRLARAIAVLADPASSLDTSRLPDPLLTFGISGLPPRHLDLIAALGTRCEVELFVPTAATSRWRHIDEARSAGQGRPEPHHPLLVSCGGLLDDAAGLLLAKADARIIEPPDVASNALVHAPVVEAPGPAKDQLALDLSPSDPGDASSPLPGSDAGSLLEHLQATIRRDEAPSPHVHLDLADGVVSDRSVQVHACHGASRQAEVLRDVLLGLLAEDPSLEPRDVLVMTPDIDGYAPLVQAAFAGTLEVPDLPVTVADRQVARTNPVADTLLAVLDLGTGRVTASQVLDILGRDVVLQRFGLDLDDLAQVAGWVHATGVRWGIDEHHRARQGQPPDRAHTWRFGLDRLLLGAAMADEGHRVIADVTPFDDIEGNDVEVAGRVAEACRTLFRFVETAQEPTDLAGWVQRGSDLLGDLIEVPPGERWRVQEVREALEGLRSDPVDQRDLLHLDLAAARAVIEGSVAGARGAAGYETGAVTLCAPVPMRSIPHRVVVLLGLDDGALPRSAVKLGFDLQDRSPRPGDRDQRREDRSLFLEAVLSARQHLIVTTSGHDVRTGEQRPPAVPLAELLDVLDASATVEDGSSVRDAITREHPLQVFSRRNFGDDGAGGVVPAFGFDPVARDAAEQVRHPQRHTPALLSEPLPPRQADPDDLAAEDPSVVQFDDLTEALLHPTRLLLTRRLGIGLREFTVEVDDLEPVALHPLTRSQFGRELLSSPEGLASPEAWRTAALAAGTVPAGTPGQVALGDLGEDVVSVVTTAAAIVGASNEPEVLAALAQGQRREIEVAIGQRRVIGEVGGLHRVADDRLVRLHLAYARPRPEHLLRAWIAHLALTAAGHTALDTWIVTRGSGDGRPEQRHLAPLSADPDEARSKATSLLAPLIAVHDRAWCELLPLFPRSSPEFVEKGRMSDARKVFVPNPYVDGDVGDRDEAITFVYGDEVTLEGILTTDGAVESFTRLAELVWGPPLANEAESAS